MVVTTAGGLPLAKGSTLSLREEDLAPVLKQFRDLHKSKRLPKLPNAKSAIPAQRPLPKPPGNGMIVRSYCTYLYQAKSGQIDRRKTFYYKENPDAWAAETQNDTLWLTLEEHLSLRPKEASVGATVEVPKDIQHRIFSTIGIDYMEGSVNALPTTKSSMTITVQKVTPDKIHLSLTGKGQMGVPFEEHKRDEARSRGCELTLSGKLTIDRKPGLYERFDLVGIGKAWGNKMNYTKRAIRIAEYPWMYGIACELVQSRKPVDLIPPYNLMHYGSGIPYFAKK